MRGRLLTLAVGALALTTAVPPGDAAVAFQILLEAPRYLAVGDEALLVAHVSSGSTTTIAAVAEFYEDGKPLGYTAGCCDGTTSTRVVHDERGVHEYAATFAGSSSDPVTVSWAIPPSAPGQLTATASQSAATFLLRWSAPGDDGGAPITRMHAYQAPGPEGPWTKFAQVGARSALTSDLPWNSTAAFAVREENVAGIGAMSAPLLVSTPAAVPPGAPRNVSITFLPEWPDIRVRWDPPADVGNGRPISYEIEVRENEGNWTRRAGTSVLDRDVVLTAWWNKTYDVRVSMKTSAGVGPTSQPVRFVTPLRDGLTATIGRADVCQATECYLVGANDTLALPFRNTTLEFEAFGDLWRNGTRAVGETVHVVMWVEHPAECPPGETCTPALTRRSVEGNVTVDASGWGAWTFGTIPARKDACVPYAIAVEADAPATVAAHGYEFTICYGNSP